MQASPPKWIAETQSSGSVAKVLNQMWASESDDAQRGHHGREPRPRVGRADDALVRHEPAGGPAAPGATRRDALLGPQAGGFSLSGIVMPCSS